MLVLLTKYCNEDRIVLEDMLSDRDLVPMLYPQYLTLPEMNTVRSDWATPPLSGQGFQLVIRRQQDDQAVGCLRIDGRDLSYFIGRRFWGNGFCGSAVWWVTNHILRGKSPMMFRAITHRENQASKRILERAGFHFVQLQHRGPRLPALLVYSLKT